MSDSLTHPEAESPFRTDHPANPGWQRFRRRYCRSWALLDDPEVLRLPGRVVIRQRRRFFWMAVIAFGGIFLGLSLLLLAAWELVEALLIASPFGLFGLSFVLIGVWKFFAQHKLSWDIGSDSAWICYGFPGFRTKLALDRRQFEAKLFSGARNELLTHSRLFLTVHPVGDARQAANVAASHSRRELLPVIEALSELLEGRFSDETVSPIELADRRTLPISTAMTWQELGNFAFGIDLDFSEPGRVSARRTQKSAVAVPWHSRLTRRMTAIRRDDELHIRWVGKIGSSKEETLSLAEIDGLQICANLRPLSSGVFAFEINLVGPSLPDFRLNWLTLNYSYSFSEGGGERKLPEVRQIANSLAEFLGKPVFDQTGL